MNFQELVFTLNQANRGAEFIGSTKNGTIEGVGTFSRVERDESPDTDSVTVIVNFPDHGIFVKATGWSSSYDGIDWNTQLIQVFPKEITVTKFVEQL